MAEIENAQYNLVEEHAIGLITEERGCKLKLWKKGGRYQWIGVN